MMRIIIAILVFIGLFTGCAIDTISGGSGSETTNTLTAVVFNPDGSPAAGASVRLRRKDFLSEDLGLESRQLISSKDTVTDVAGRFTIDSVDTGAYYIEAFTGNNLALLFSTEVFGDEEIIDLQSDTLKAMATIAGLIDFAGDTSDALIKVYGIDRAASIDDSGNYTISVPAREKLVLKITSENSKAKVYLNEELDPGELEVVSYDFHTYQSDSIEVRNFLNNMGLTSIVWDSVVLREFEGIEGLDLTGLGITELHHSIGDLDFLGVLILDSNPISDLPVELAELEDLYEISLESTNISGFPELLLEMIYLSEINLSYNEILSVPDGIIELEDLEGLSLAGCGLAEFPHIVLNIAELNILDLSDNLITEIPEEIDTLKMLTGLLLGANKLTSIPESITELSYLEELSLAENSITSIPDDIGNLSNIIILDIADNQLTALPASIVNLTPHEYLDVSGNPFEPLPQEISDWITLYSD